MSSTIKNVAKLLLLGLCCLAAWGRADATVPAKPRGIVIVAESAGAQLYLSDSLSSVINEANLPYRVQVTDWSTLNVQTDYQSQYNFAVKAQKLAGRVLELRHACPDVRIVLVGNGAGGTVAVKAAEMLPPHQVQRIILLGPTLSCSYDLRRALLATCDGIDSFYCKDDLTLELAGQYRGTSDKTRETKCAGLNGFVPQVGSASDASLYGRLRQCGIKESDANDVNLCHLRYMSSSFLRQNVVPMLEASIRTRPCPPCSTPPAPPAPPPPYAPPPPPSAPKYPVPPAPMPKYPVPPATTPQYRVPPTPAPQYPAPPVPAPQSPVPPTYVPISPPLQAAPPTAQPAPQLPPPFPPNR